MLQDGRYSPGQRIFSDAHDHVPVYADHPALKGPQPIFSRAVSHAAGYTMEIAVFEVDIDV